MIEENIWKAYGMLLKLEACIDADLKYPALASDDWDVGYTEAARSYAPKLKAAIRTMESEYLA